MVYIPKDWLKNKDNMHAVHEILDKLDADIKTENAFTEEDAIKELEAIKEDIIIDKLKAKAFILGA